MRGCAGTDLLLMLFTLLYIKLLLWVLTTRWFYARESWKDNIPVLNYQVRGSYGTVCMGNALTNTLDGVPSPPPHPRPSIHMIPNDDTDDEYDFLLPSSDDESSTSDDESTSDEE